MEIKICGITKLEEMEKLIELNVDYAGLVVNFKKSRRNNTFEEAKLLMKNVNKLSGKIKKVAVMVSPKTEDIEKVYDYGFDIVQIHGEIKNEIIEKCKLPIIAAVNMSEEINLMKEIDLIIDKEKRWCNGKEKILAILFDNKLSGKGETFNWQHSLKEIKAIKEKYINKKIVLAGGININNVKQGVKYFNPDIVDCSSGVEFDDKTKKGKDLLKIKKFVEEVRR